MKLYIVGPDVALTKSNLTGAYLTGVDLTRPSNIVKLAMPDELLLQSIEIIFLETIVGVVSLMCNNSTSNTYIDSVSTNITITFLFDSTDNEKLTSEVIYKLIGESENNILAVDSQTPNIQFKAKVYRKKEDKITTFKSKKINEKI